jgi:hypothetical protein
MIDAKTDSEEPGEAGAAILRERYAEQLRGYQESTARLFALPPERVALALLRVPAGEVISL